MKYFEPQLSSAQKKYMTAQLENLLSQPTIAEQRPCINCKVYCSCSNSNTCTCMCSWKCPYLPIELSSEPTRYPIEEKIIPLVFEINTLRLTTTFWSCEGHANKSGAVVKIPKVMFYAQSILLPNLISEYIQKLQFKNILTYEWLVKAQGLSPNMQAIYSLEPDDGRNFKTMKLDLIQNDIARMANTMCSFIRDNAKAHLDKLAS